MLRNSFSNPSQPKIKPRSKTAFRCIWMEVIAGFQYVLIHILFHTVIPHVFEFHFRRFSMLAEVTFLFQLCDNTHYILKILFNWHFNLITSFIHKNLCYNFFIVI